MIEEKYKPIVKQIKDDRQRLMDKYERAGYKICMPIKYIKKREVVEKVIFDDDEVDSTDDSLFIEPVVEKKEKDYNFEFEEENPELEKELNKVHEEIRKDTESDKKSWNPFKKKSKK